MSFYFHWGVYLAYRLECRLFRWILLYLWILGHLLIFGVLWVMVLVVWLSVVWIRIIGMFVLLGPFLFYVILLLHNLLLLLHLLHCFVNLIHLRHLWNIKTLVPLFWWLKLWNIEEVKNLLRFIDLVILWMSFHILLLVYLFSLLRIHCLRYNVRVMKLG